MTCANTSPMGKKIKTHLRPVKNVYESFSGRRSFFIHGSLRQLTGAEENPQKMSACGSAERVMSEASF